MGRFFIETRSGQLATARQLREAGLIAPGDDAPALPWHPVQGPPDASTMWYAIVRKQTHGVFIARLVLRHGGQHACLRDDPEWEEIDPSAIGLR